MDKIQCGMTAAGALIEEGCRSCFVLAEEAPYVQILGNMDSTCEATYFLCKPCFKVFQNLAQNKEKSCEEGKIIGWASPITSALHLFTAQQMAKLDSPKDHFEALQTLGIIKIWNCYQQCHASLIEGVSKDLAEIKPSIESSQIDAFLEAISENNQDLLKYIVSGWNSEIKKYGIAMKEHRINGVFWFECLLTRCFEKAQIFDKFDEFESYIKSVIFQLDRIEQIELNSSFDLSGFLSKYCSAALLEFLIERKDISFTKGGLITRFIEDDIVQKTVEDKRSYDLSSRVMQISRIQFIYHLNTILPKPKQLECLFSNYLIFSEEVHLELVSLFGSVYNKIENEKTDEALFNLLQYLKLLKENLVRNKIPLPFTTEFYIGPEVNPLSLQEYFLDLLNNCNALLLSKHKYVVENLCIFHEADDGASIERKLQELEIALETKLPVINEITSPHIDLSLNEYDFKSLMLFQPEAGEILNSLTTYYKIKQSDLFIGVWRRFREGVIETQKILRPTKKART
jgi:hypothetical protein